MDIPMGIKHKVDKRLFQRGKKQTTKYVSQARRVIAKFGGATKLSKALTQIGKPKCRVQVSKWDMSIEAGGTGGIIPARAMMDVLEAARYEGIMLSKEDLDPREMAVNTRDFPEVVSQPSIDQNE